MTFKKKKLVETLNPSIKAMDLDDFECDEVILKDIVVLTPPIIYLDGHLWDS